MLTKIGIVWAIIDLLLGLQMIYYVVTNTGTTYPIIVIVYWLWLGIYAWNPFNIFYKEKQYK